MYSSGIVVNTKIIQSSKQASKNTPTIFEKEDNILVS